MKVVEYKKQNQIYLIVNYIINKIELLKKYFCIGTMLIAIKRFDAKIFFCAYLYKEKECEKN